MNETHSFDTMQPTIAPARAFEAAAARVTFPWRALAAILLVALAGRVLLLATNSVSFHSDEAVVALMARHILQGERPVFFYGQAYMGSLDAWLVAVGFRLLGESVAAIRVVQAALYLLVVATGFAAAWALSARRLVALTAGLSLAIPPVLLALYTTATLGGYNETLIFGNLLIILGYQVTHGKIASWWRWLALGLAAGLGWWTNGLIIAFAAPVALLVLYRAWRPHAAFPVPARARLPGLALALVGFFAGSAPWWAFNFQHDFAALAFYVGGGASDFAGNDVGVLPLDQRLFGLLFLGLPTLLGLRFPWSPEFFAPAVGALLVFTYGFALVRLARGIPAADGRPALRPDARGLLLLMIGLYAVIFLLSKFSIDPTGRYFLPLAVPFAVALGALLTTIRHPARGLWQAGILALVLGYYAAGQGWAAGHEPGMTTQFNLDTHIPNTYDDALMALLEAHRLDAGYTSYWVAFRMAFLSNERLQYSSALPYKPSLDYTAADERYPAYRAAADQADNPAYITANVAEVRAGLEQMFAEQGLAYDRAEIGPYTIFYNVGPTAPRPPFALHQ